MRSPSEYFLKYLASDPSLDMHGVAREAIEAGVEVPLEYLAQLRNNLDFPCNYSPTDDTHGPTKEFLKQERIWGLWHPDAKVKEAIQLYETPAYRSTVCTSVLAGFTDRSIASLLLDMHGVSVMEESVAEFRHYFWNLTLVTRDEMASQLVSHKDDIKSMLKPTYLSALKGPKNHEAGAHLALYKMGMWPRELDKVKILKTLRDQSYLNALDTETMLQGRSRSEAFRNYAGMALSLQNKLDDIEQLSDDVLKEFSQWVRLRKGEGEHPSMNDVITNEPPMLADIIDAQVEEIDDGKSN